MKLPPSAASHLLQSRHTNSDSSTNTTDCGCLGGGAVAGIVIGSIVGSFLLYWLIKMAFGTTVGDEKSYTTYEVPRSRSRSRRSRSRRSSYVSPVRVERPMSTRRGYRRDLVERPPKVYYGV